MHKPIILIALFRLPYPVTDGSRYRIFNNLVSGLKKDYDIECFVVQIKQYKQSDIDYIERHFGKVHLFYHSKIAYALNGLRALVTGLPMQAQAFHFTDAQRWLDAHVDEYDAIYVHEIRMTEFFINYSDERKSRCVVDFNDAISLNYETSLAHMNLPLRLFYRWEGRRVSRYESKVINEFKHMLVISERDRHYLLEKAGLVNKYESGELDFAVIHYGAPVSDVVASRNKLQVFFMGSLDYAPNRNAVDWLVTALWPVLVQQIPQLELLVIGGGKVENAWKNIPGITFAGFVPNVFSAVESARLLLASIAFAGGTPSKIIEAMGYGIPVLTTYEGAAGISGVVHGVNILTLPKHNVSQWVETIVSFLNHTELQDQLAQAGKELIKENYSLNSIEAAFRARFAKLIKSNLTNQ